MEARQGVGQAGALDRCDRADRDGLDGFGRRAAPAQLIMEPDQFPGPGQDLMASRIESGRAAAAIEKGKAQRLFEPLHLGADGCLGQADRLARPGKSARASDGDQGLQLSDHRRRQPGD